MISKIKTKLMCNGYKILPVMTAFVTIGAALIPCVVRADARSLMEMAIKIIAKLITASGVITFVLGLVAWSMAHGDSDGPGQKKAGGMIAAGVTLFALSLILSNIAPELASNIETSL
ncbi:MAG: hypothetical protein K5931_04020 [Lachnospiraceae bacterium]|nr:hypothetical protein [Lachnospiraceae bacterium]